MRNAPLVPPRAILFDWDETLVDNWAAIHLALNAALDAMGRPTWTFRQTKDRVRESMRDSFPRLFGERWAKAGRVFSEAFRACHLDQLKPLPGAEPSLTALTGAGIYLGVVSNKQGDLLRAEVAHLQWSSYFGGVVGAADAARDKPAPEPIAMALRNGGPAPGPEVWFVGDTGLDMACARGSGCLPILIGSADPRAAEFEHAQPAITVAGFDDLLALVRTVQSTIS
jgi:phosphoglycolate phosphatase